MELTPINLRALPMNPHDLFCPQGECPLRGQKAKGNVVIHSRQERRYRCLCCGHTFVGRKGTAFYRLHTEEAVVTLVVTLLAHGCPPQAVVAAFGFDERTVRAWQGRAGTQSEQVHRATVRQGQVELEHVQADELWVKLVGRKVWMALALAVPSRLWLGGVISSRRDGDLIRDLVEQVRRGARNLGILVCVDGLASYVTAFCRAFKETVPTAKRGGQPKRLPESFLLGQVIKSAVQCRGVEVAHRAVIGSLAQIEQRLRATGGGQVIHTASIERLNATFCSRLAPLIRRGRCLARKETTLHAGMYLVGTVYNFCCFHDSLRLLLPDCRRRKWQARTPAMAAGLTDHRWTVDELLRYRVAPKPWERPRRRGRPPKEPHALRWKLRPHRRVLCSSTV
jgi:transposase-like protein